MADFDQVESATGYVVGAVPPIALPDSVTVVCDSSIDSYDKVIIGSGVLGYALSLAGDDLKSVMGDSVATGDFIKDEE
jgi:Cys-tRNA(Pro)/Cys-tRNA(Cys) deacylase